MKYTKEQVITSLELHNWSSGARCKNCSYKNHVNCTTDLLTDAIALLKDTTVEESKWIPVSTKPGVYAGMKCSLCKAKISYKDFYSGNHNYCYKCGAKMIKEDIHE